MVNRRLRSAARAIKPDAAAVAPNCVNSEGGVPGTVYFLPQEGCVAGQAGAGGKK
jgi:hypothetical protein